MKIKILKTALLGAALTGLFSVSALAVNEGAGTVNASDVNLRSAAGMDSSIVSTLALNSPVAVIDRSDSAWYKVWCAGQEGYVASQYISFAEVLDASYGQGVIQGMTVRMRSGPSLSANTLGYYDTGTVMDVTGISGGWYKVSCNGVAGYVSSDYLALANQQLELPDTAAAASAGDLIVETAMQYMGVPYVWAGTSPNGFDCSGFVYYVFGENGYKTNRTAESLFSNGEYVERSELIPGDIICFYSGGYSYIGHVGIYIGDNEFIHASSSSGQVVIDSLDQNYYDSHYYGARRIAG